MKNVRPCKVSPSIKFHHLYCQWHETLWRSDCTEHVEAVKRVLRYLKSADLGIVFDGSMNQELVAYADADFARDIDTRRSRSGFIILMNGGPVSWESVKQS